MLIHSLPLLTQIFLSFRFHFVTSASPSIKISGLLRDCHRIEAILQNVMKVLGDPQIGVPFAQIWGSAEYCGGAAAMTQDAQRPAKKMRMKGLKTLTCASLPCCVQHTQFVPYRNLCSDSHVIVGRGFVGTAFDSSCTVWHTDVNQVPEVSHLARGLHSRCMAAIPVVLAPSDRLGGGLDLGGGLGLDCSL